MDDETALRWSACIGELLARVASITGREQQHFAPGRMSRSAWIRFRRSGPGTFDSLLEACAGLQVSHVGVLAAVERIVNLFPVNPHDTLGALDDVGATAVLAHRVEYDAALGMEAVRLVGGCRGLRVSPEGAMAVMRYADDDAFCVSARANASRSTESVPGVPAEWDVTTVHILMQAGGDPQRAGDVLAWFAAIMRLAHRRRETLHNFIVVGARVVRTLVSPATLVARDPPDEPFKEYAAAHAAAVTTEDKDWLVRGWSGWQILELAGQQSHKNAKDVIGLLVRRFAEVMQDAHRAAGLRGTFHVIAETDSVEYRDADDSQAAGDLPPAVLGGPSHPSEAVAEGEHGGATDPGVAEGEASVRDSQDAVDLGVDATR